MHGKKHARSLLFAKKASKVTSVWVLVTKKLTFSNESLVEKIFSPTTYRSIKLGLFFVFPCFTMKITILHTLGICAIKSIALNSLMRWSRILSNPQWSGAIGILCYPPVTVWTNWIPLLSIVAFLLDDQAWFWLVIFFTLVLYFEFSLTQSIRSFKKMLYCQPKKICWINRIKWLCHQNIEQTVSKFNIIFFKLSITPYPNIISSFSSIFFSTKTYTVFPILFFTLSTC